MSTRALLPFLLVFSACKKEEDDTGEVPTDTTGIATRADGWLRGDLHMHTTHSDGWDDTATVIGLAEYLGTDTFVAFHPEYEGNALDFIAITDHRTVAVQSDPAYESELLVLVGGEEFGSPGHANCFGVHAFVDHDPGDDGVTVEDIQAGVAAAHAQGAVFSPNHPFLPGIPFPWDIRDHDSVEIWNSGWALMSPEMTPEVLADWEASHGTASPIYRKALQATGQGSEMQALVWVEAQLSRGVHVAVVAGSDRHAVLLPGFPTTWVRADSVDEPGVVGGIEARHTFVSRTPASAQVLMEVEVGAERWQMGDAIPIPAGGAEAVVTVRAGRADGGKVRIVRGEAVASDDALETATLGAIVLEEDVAGDDFEATATLQVTPGTWFYPVVIEPLYADGLTEEQEQTVLATATAAIESGEEDFLGLASLAGQFIGDPELLSHAEYCDPEDWSPDQFQCLPPDADGMASFFIPDWIDRAMNATFTDGAPDGWSMGAVGSAVRFVAE